MRELTDKETKALDIFNSKVCDLICHEFGFIFSKRHCLADQMTYLAYCELRWGTRFGQEPPIYERDQE